MKYYNDEKAEREGFACCFSGKDIASYIKSYVFYFMLTTPGNILCSAPAAVSAFPFPPSLESENSNRLCLTGLE